MNLSTRLAVLAALLFAVPSCGDHDHDHTHGPGGTHDHPAPAAGQASDHGPSVSIGSIAIDGQNVAAAFEGTFAPGAEVGLDLTFEKGKPMPTAVRAWIGAEDGTGSMKAKLAKEGEQVLHAHVEVPKPVPEGSKLWLDVETAAGSQRLSLALPK